MYELLFAISGCFTGCVIAYYSAKIKRLTARMDQSVRQHARESFEDGMRHGITICKRTHWKGF